MRESITSGFIPEQFLKDEIVAGNVRPSLWLQYKKKRLDSVRKSRLARVLDFCFIPPHAKLFYKQQNSLAGVLYNNFIHLAIRRWK
jgi:hypothetical protein